MLVGDFAGPVLDLFDLVEEVGRAGVGQVVLGLPVRVRGLQQLQQLVLGEVGHVEDDLPSLGAQARVLTGFVALDDNQRRFHSGRAGGPELGGGRALGRAGGMVGARRRGGREHGALGEADGSHSHLFTAGGCVGKARGSERIEHEGVSALPFSQGGTEMKPHPYTPQSSDLIAPTFLRSRKNDLIARPSITRQELEEMGANEFDIWYIYRV
mmetsp:Transcript_23592/g.57818  ORF Transcript_23592/g.57818 Transcript_23592/m.57818 type:complete len:212 (-) Transcript_23592:98-733(-)